MAKGNTSAKNCKNTKATSSTASTKKAQAPNQDSAQLCDGRPSAK